LKEVHQQTNQTYERMQKIEMKKQQEESVCEVFNEGPKAPEGNPYECCLEGRLENNDDMDGAIEKEDIN